jgi:hypothetical protein
MKSSCRSPPKSKSPRGKKDAPVGTTADGHLDAHPAAPNKPSGLLNPTAKGTGTLSVPTASKEAVQRHTCPGTPCDMSGSMSDMPAGTTASTYVDKKVPIPRV